MPGQKTAYAVALLNLFRLTSVHADDFYDALKAKNKYDAKTVNEVRKSTVETSRAQQMNDQTKSNPIFTPLSGKEHHRMTDEEYIKQRDLEKNLPPDENDKGADKIVEGADPGKAPVAKTEDAPSKKAPKIAKPDSDGPPVKVTTDDPDEVTFEAEKPVHAPAKPAAPSPAKKK